MASVPRRVLDWLDTRIGLKAQVLRPVPDYSLNPLYWLGAITVIAFAVQVVTGLLMLIYYVPTVEQAYSSTQFIMNSVPLGKLIETVHMYTAYAMILLAFLHLMRGYFVSAHKKPRELMWVMGMLMGVIVLAMGLTGYLLPWTVVSKSATDVSVAMLSFLPAQLGNVLIFLIVGPGGDVGELTRFFDLHIIVLPAALLVLLAIKMYMFEVHGAAEPPGGLKGTPKDAPWFPTVVLYFAMMGCVFVALALASAALFPLSLPPQFTPATAGTITSQPEWYFLWMYQVLKFQVFEGDGITYALGAVTLVLAVNLLLPFLDMGSERKPTRRPLYTTLGLVAVAELLVLTVWGYATPGEVISNQQAALVLGGVAASVSAICALTYWSMGYRLSTRGLGAPSVAKKLASELTSNGSLTAGFVLMLTVASISLATSVNIVTSGSGDMSLLALASSAFVFSFFLMGRALRSMNPNLKRKTRL